VRRLLSRFPTSMLMGLAFTIPAMLMAGVLLFYHSMVAQKYLADEGVYYSEILADQILSASQRFLRLGSRAAIQEMIEDTGSKRSVEHLALIGSDGRIIASNRREWIGQPDTVIPEPTYREVTERARATFQTQHQLVDGGNRIVLVSPLLVQGDNTILWNSRGTLYLKVDHEEKLREIYEAILRRGTASAIGILTVSLFLLLWVRAILARPILRVAAFLRRFAAGGTEAPPKVEGPQEVAELIEDVERMVRDLKEKRVALEASEERHRRLLEGAYDAILTVDPDSGRILEANDMFCRMFGYSVAEARALSLTDLHPAEERPTLARFYADAAAHGLRSFHDVPCLTRDGERILVDLRGGPIPLESRTVTEWILRDTTERRRLEEQLRQAQKMETVATLSGGIAHDFNNLLTGILGYSRLVLGRMKASDPNRKQLEVIEQSSLRAAELTAQLLTFSRRAASRPLPCDLNEILEEVAGEVRSELPPGIDLTVHPAPDLWTVAADRTQIRQALLRLCDNAREAMPEGGRLRIEAANRTLAEDDRRGNLEARAGRFVTLSVQDSGPGIDARIRARIFEPFFTTKKGMKSAGLGLAMVYGSIKGHDGWVEVSSEPGRGSTFVLYLPVHDPSAERAGTESAAEILARMAGVVAEGPAPRTAGTRTPRPSPGAAKRTVLAVDDESTVLALAKDILEMHGYRVLTARNGEEALRLFQQRHAEIDMVLLDLTMPVMGGMECFREMRRIDAAVRVVISSGFSADTTASEVIAEGAMGYVSKPYDIDALARVIREAFERTPPAADPPPAAPPA
jgi:PAS domain S-box-containing protein